MISITAITRYRHVIKIYLTLDWISFSMLSSDLEDLSVWHFGFKWPLRSRDAQHWIHFRSRTYRNGFKNGICNASLNPDKSWTMLVQLSVVMKAALSMLHADMATNRRQKPAGRGLTNDPSQESRLHLTKKFRHTFSYSSEFNTVEH